MFSDDVILKTLEYFASRFSLPLLWLLMLNDDELVYSEKKLFVVH